MVEPPAYVETARVERLNSGHDYDAFRCRDRPMAHWFRRYALQTQERGNARVWVWTDQAEPSVVLGYFSVSPYVIVKEAVPDSPIVELMRIPSILIGKLARSNSAPVGSGGFLLGAAMEVALDGSDQIGGRYLVLDALNEKVAQWYERFQFQRAVTPAGEVPGETIRLLMLLDKAREVTGR